MPNRTIDQNYITTKNKGIAIKKNKEIKNTTAIKKQININNNVKDNDINNNKLLIIIVQHKWSLGTYFSNASYSE